MFASQEIATLTEQVLTADGGIVASFSSALLPHRVLAASVVPFGPCRLAFDAAVGTAASAAAQLAGDDGYLTALTGVDRVSRRRLLYVVVPLTVTAVALVAVFAACVPLLCRRRRRAKETAGASAHGYRFFLEFWKPGNVREFG